MATRKHRNKQRKRLTPLVKRRVKREMARAKHRQPSSMKKIDVSTEDAAFERSTALLGVHTDNLDEAKVSTVNSVIQLGGILSPLRNTMTVVEVGIENMKEAKSIAEDKSDDVLLRIAKQELRMWELDSVHIRQAVEDIANIEHNLGKFVKQLDDMLKGKHL